MHVTLRPATAADAAFLRELFAAVRAPMFAALPDEVVGPLLDQQHEAQQRGHAAAHPDADHQIVELDGRPVGRWLVDRSRDHLVLVDIAVHPELQGRDIGSRLLAGLVDESERTGRPIDLHVAEHSPAHRWYLESGFRDLHSDGAYVQMTRDTTGGHGDRTVGTSGGA